MVQHNGRVVQCENGPTIRTTRTVNEDKAARYHRLRRRATLLDTAVVALLLLLLLVTGASAALRDWASVATGRSPSLTVTIYLVLIALLIEAVRLPVAFYRGVVLERRYELSTEVPGRWWWDRAKALVVGLPLAVLVGLVVWSLVWWTPAYWWLVAGLCFALMLVLVAHAAPVLFMPLFDRCEPVQRSELARRLVALAERVGARVLGVFEWRVSGRTRTANAVLVGLGRTRRILLSDTLLAGHSDDEIEVILAHELAHHVHHDIWTAMALESSLVLVGFFLAHHALGAVVGQFGVEATSDVAGLPVVLLASGAVTVGFLPVAHALSRAHERRADRYALDITGHAEAFTSAMKRLAAQNLAEERPSRLVELLFLSHPPVASRLDAVRTWESRKRAPAR